MVKFGHEGAEQGKARDKKPWCPNQTKGTTKSQVVYHMLSGRLQKFLVMIQSPWFELSERDGM
jgi:hypothetical protein